MKKTNVGMFPFFSGLPISTHGWCAYPIATSIYIGRFSSGELQIAGMRNKKCRYYTVHVAGARNKSSIQIAGVKVKETYRIQGPGVKVAYTVWASEVKLSYRAQGSEVKLAHSVYTECRCQIFIQSVKVTFWVLNKQGEMYWGKVLFFWQRHSHWMAFTWQSTVGWSDLHAFSTALEARSVCKIPAASTIWHMMLAAKEIHIYLQKLW